MSSQPNFGGFGQGNSPSTGARQPMNPNNRSTQSSFSGNFGGVASASPAITQSFSNSAGQLAKPTNQTSPSSSPIFPDGLSSAPPIFPQHRKTSTAPITGGGPVFETRRPQLQLLKGHGFKVVVGPKDTASYSNYGTESWSLPKALICHYSPFLNAACTRDFRERKEDCIYLPEDDPKIFGLYVEWMYYGTYTLGTQPGADLGRDASSDAKAWVLGDKLLSTDFQNYAMSRLYTQYATNFGFKPVRTIDIKYACVNSAANSQLRRFFFDLAATHFQNSARVVGTTEEWDQFLLHHADVRAFLLCGLRMASNQRQFLKDKDAYMEKEPVQPSASTPGLKQCGTTPAKRTADGAHVKEQSSNT